MCKSCFDEYDRRKEIHCPCCRAKRPKNEKESANLSLRRAEKGCPISQMTLANMYTRGTGVKQNLKKAAYWNRLSADQGNADAQYLLATMFISGEGGCKNSDLEAEKYFALAAKQKHPAARFQLGMLMEKNGRVAEAVKCFTLIHAELQKHDFRYLAQCHLAISYLPSEVEAGSLERALYWGKMAALSGHEDAPTLVADLLACIHSGYFGGTVNAGFDGQPEIAYWLKKGVAKGCKKGEEKFQEMDSSHRSKCAKCLKPASSISGAMKRCTRCKLMRYCSAECQRSHWKAGHSLDCCDKNGKTRFSLFPDDVSKGLLTP